VRAHVPLPTGSTSHVALKVVNNREPMRKAGEREVETLRTLATSDPAGRYHTVRLLHTAWHAGHLCLAFEPMAANLKEVADKFGKGVGVPLGAVRVYAAQLLLALGLLGKLGYVHGDIKPHNILASEDYRTLKLGDFGSAFRWESEPDAEAPQPYVGSRFYRAPEAILGGRCSPPWDMWSAACLLFELYTGGPLFPGQDNNDMLWRIQALRGPFPHRLLRRHCAGVAAVGQEALELHFDPATLAFRRRVADAVSKEVSVKLVEVTAPSESLGVRLQASRAGDSKRAVAAFQALLEGMLALDPARRCTVSEALGSAFIRGAA
jgi:serine/threonine-protein kinase PRP4